MNRHERRRQKKNNRINNTSNQELIEAIKLHTNRNYKKAEVLYKKVLLADKSNYEAIRHLGILNQDLKNYKKAHKYFLQAIKVNTNGFEALNNLGTIYLHNKNYDLALRCLKGH